MTAVEMKLVEKIKRLPPEKLAEVENFVDFITSQVQREAAFDRLLAIPPALEGAGVQSMSEEDGMALVRQVRTERRTRFSQGEDDMPGASRP
jgi:hypothetical protein